MSPSPRQAPRAGGFVIAACILLGTLIGGSQGETSAGLVIGAGVGLLIAALIWLRDRRRA